MADIMLYQAKGKRANPPRIDLTPLVDLGFLLITFFVFTATLNQPAAMTAILPSDSKDSSNIAASGAVSIIVGAHGMSIYTGTQVGSAVNLGYRQSDSLRKMLLGFQQSLLAAHGNDDKLFVLIKPTEKASFGSIVDLLDEMKICRLRRYTLAGPAREDLAAFEEF